MTEQVLAMMIFAAVFAVAGFRKIHVGVVALVGASLTGLFLADMTFEEIVAGFPVNLLMLLAGVTLFFGLAQVNGTIDAIIDRSLMRFSGRAHLMPLLFFMLATLVSAMAATAALAIIPIAMQVARRYRIDPMLMSVSVGTGLTVGMFAPIGLFGIITAGTAEEAGIDLNPLLLFAVAAGINVMLLIVGHVLYGGRTLYRARATDPVQVAEFAGVGGRTPEGIGASGAPTGGAGSGSEPLREAPPFTAMQKVTVGAIIAFVAMVIGLEVADIRIDIGLISFIFAAFLLIVDPSLNGPGLKKIDWSVVLLVGGIITFVNVLQTIGAVALLGDLAADIGSSLLAAFILFVVGGLVSAFASTTGTLAAVVPLSIPLAATGDVSGWAVIIALALCSALADVAPFSTVGATMVATSPEWPGRPIHSRLLAWGMAMVVVGPVLFTFLLIMPTSL